jgi:TolA-binding protein
VKRVPAVLLLAAAMLPAAAADPTTVGSITQGNGRQQDGWFLARTPSILRVTPSAQVGADLRVAIADYDRLLELADAEPQLRAEALRRGAYLRLRLADRGEATDAELARAIELYERALAEHPDDPANDHALYQLARARQLAGDDGAATALLRTLGDAYPRSPLRADALFRSAELSYLAGDYETAAHEYRRVLDMDARLPQYQPAQYKYGWSLYRLGRHEEAVPVFLAILDRELPARELDDPVAALSGVGARQAELAGESLRVLGLSFAALGGGPAVSRHFQSVGGEPRYLAMLYAALGAQLQAQRRYTDAAQAYESFAQLRPQHRLAPRFRRHAIAALEAGGFGELMLAAQARYVEAYAPDSAYWQDREADAATVADVRTMLDGLARHRHAQALALAADDTQRRAAFDAAAQTWRRQLELFPQDEAVPQTTLLLADALLEAGRTEDAARHYLRSAYEYADHARAPEAAYAAAQTWRQLAAREPARHDSALREAIDAALKLAERFPAHPRRFEVLVAAAQDLHELKEYDAAAVQAQRVLDARAPGAPSQQARVVIADARFAQARYEEAEAAYTQLLASPGGAPAARSEWQRRVAVGLYRRGELARAQSQWLEAAQLFERAGDATADVALRAAADYDAASAYVELKDWPAAQRGLERFRARHPGHALLADTDRKLAAAYENGSQWAAAAAVYARIAQRPEERPDLRREAAWLSAALYDRASASAAAEAYERYVATYPAPLPAAQQARQRLVELHARSPALAQQWLRAIVEADAAAGRGSDAASRQLAARAGLELGRAEAVAAARVSLRTTDASRLQQRLKLTQSAVAMLDRAAAYGYADTTTAAAYEIGALYRELARALLTSERPAGLQPLEREQYELLLEEQAFPFEERAIAAHENNLARLRQGLWNEWINRSSVALADLVPVKYAKRDSRENSYDSLH